ncbi:uncharacterized protein LOC125757847 [Rhipicephalus sanguineus]|uniref:uncharacterized protein LOC125757847 n=1 Tax=Rhipicephalus sanguineus TaxID=34632 RepID=UPI0020C40EDA|nr:uncharacterized protein LOC125757847 [Rhipicephalus sanguineus]
MGHRISKETMNPRTGLTPTENRLLKKTWRSLCDNNRDYGVLILQGFFAKQPDAIHLFQHFRGKPAKSLPTDMSFRIHACAVGYQLTSMVENCDDVELLEALIRKNAQVHKPHLGVTPMHFRIMTKAIMDVLHAKVSKLMTPDAVVAWEKLFTFIVTVTAIVFESSKVASNAKKKSEDNISNASASSKMLNSQKSSSASAGSSSIGHSRSSTSRSSLNKSRASVTAIVPYVDPSGNGPQHEATRAPSTAVKAQRSKISLKEQLKAKGKKVDT